jgi:hypothetical protein
MAKRKSSSVAFGEKARLARELIAQGKGNKEVAALMSEQGISIHPNYVSTLRAKAGGKKRRRRRKSKGEAAASTPAPQTAGGGLRDAINFCKAVGGIRAAEKLLATLREIKDL